MKAFWKKRRVMCKQKGENEHNERSGTFDGKVSGPGLEPTKKGKKSHAGNIRMQKTMSISPEINLIGQTTAEAIPELQKYLDDAYLAHLPQVRVVHGRGTGVLRKAVHAQLKKLKYVDSFRLGEFGEGQDGVTIVMFKK